VVPAAVLTLAVGVPGCAGTAPSPAAGTGSTGATTTAATTTAAPSSSDAGVPAATEGRRIEVGIAGGAVRGDTGRVSVDVGSAVTLVVTSDVADEVHVHGYDVTTELAEGTPAQLTFEATLMGVFEVELHEAGTVLLTLQVQ
jgi:hypothetical protein